MPTNFVGDHPAMVTILRTRLPGGSPLDRTLPV
jgi:hypothetical protein